MSSHHGVIVITGANGFLGRSCCQAFTAAGFEVRALVRNPSACGDLQSVARGGLFHCNLPGNIDEAAFQGEVRVFLHCAYATIATTEDQTRRTNLEGTGALLRLARQAAIRQMVFVSSLSSHNAATSLYGRTKLQLEKLFDAPSDTIVRPGTIIGRGGVFERTREMLLRLPAVPLFFAGRKLQTIWIGDVCDGILAAVQRPVAGNLVLAHPQGVLLADFYRQIAALDGRSPKLVPFPGDLAIFLTSMAEKLGLQLPIHSDNLLGMKHLRRFDPTADLERLGIRPISFAESLRRLG